MSQEDELELDYTYSPYVSADEMISMHASLASTVNDEEESMASFPGTEELIQLINKDVSDSVQYDNEYSVATFLPPDDLHDFTCLLDDLDLPVDDAKGKSKQSTVEELDVPLPPKKKKVERAAKVDSRFSMRNELNERDLEPKDYAIPNPTKITRSTARIVRALQLRGKLDIREMMTYGQCDQKRVYDIANVLITVGLVTREPGSKFYVLGKPMKTAFDIYNINTSLESLKAELANEQSKLHKVVSIYHAVMCRCRGDLEK